MTIHEARQIAYDIKARHINTALRSTSELENAMTVLMSGRAVAHRQDNDRRLAETIKRYIS